MTSGVVLGVDYGEKRMGVAVALTSLAEPVSVIENNPLVEQEIGRLVEKYQVDLVVVGVSENVMGQQSLRFADELRQKLTIPVETFDETLSSRQATEQLRHKHKSFRKRHQDAYQAAVMLQDWLDSQPTIPTPSAGAISRA